MFGERFSFMRLSTTRITLEELKWLRCSTRSSGHTDTFRFNAEWIFEALIFFFYHTTLPSFEQRLWNKSHLVRFPFLYKQLPWRASDRVYFTSSSTDGVSRTFGLQMDYGEFLQGRYDPVGMITSVETISMSHLSFANKPQSCQQNVAWNNLVSRGCSQKRDVVWGQNVITTDTELIGT